MDRLFSPPGERWLPVSPRLATMRRVLVLVAAGMAVLVLLAAWWWWRFPPLLLPIGVVLSAGGALTGWVVVGRNVASWRYAEREEDLYIAHGVMRRHLVVVPYGRMQYVDLRAGPFDQAFGLATLHLHTASPGTSARLPGLPAREAARLRDRLTALGEAQAAGL